MHNKKAFTLAEVMIVLTVIGIISAIIMPIAFQSVPDKNVMLFKKAHNTFYQVMSELVNSDKYFKDGHLGFKADGTRLDKTHSGDATYMCNTFADVLSTKNVSCYTDEVDTCASSCVGSKRTIYNQDYNPESPDTRCKCAQEKHDGPEITTADGASFYQVNVDLIFGSPWAVEGDSQWSNCVYSGGSAEGCKKILYFEVHKDDYGFPAIYKIFCMDIDGFKKGVECDDVNDICPFGYAVRYDGRILNGKRASEWLEKDLNSN